MAIHLEMVGCQLDDFHQIITLKKWLEITISIQLKLPGCVGFQKYNSSSLLFNKKIRVLAPSPGWFRFQYILGNFFSDPFQTPVGNSLKR